MALRAKGKGNVTSKLEVIDVSLVGALLWSLGHDLMGHLMGRHVPIVVPV